MENEIHYLFDNKALRTLIIPLIIEQLLSICVGMADSVMIANVGEAAVSGVSLVDGVMILFINVFAALATGGAVIAGQYLGQKNRRQASESATQLVWFSTIIALGVMVLVYVGKGFILHTVFGKIDDDVAGYANTYLLIVAASIPFMALYNSGAAIFRAMGNSKISMKVSIIMNIINVIGNAILVYGVKMGSAGVAIPTLVSRIVAAVMITVLLCDRNLPVHIRPTFRYRVRWPMVRRILYIGIPNGMENSMFQLGKIVVLSLVSGFGTSAIAANAVCNAIAPFQTLPGMAINLAITTVIARCVGASDYDQAKYYTKKLHKLIYLCHLVTVLGLLALLPLILRLYRLSDQTASLAVDVMLMYSVFALLIWAPSFSLPNVLRAAGDVKYAMVISIGSMVIFRIAFSYIFGLSMNLGVLGVWMAMILDWLIRAICFFYRYKSGKWMNRQVV